MNGDLAVNSITGLEDSHLEAGTSRSHGSSRGMRIPWHATRGTSN